MLQPQNQSQLIVPVSTVNPEFGGRSFLTSSPEKIEEFSHVLGYRITAYAQPLSLPQLEVNRSLFTKLADGDYLAVAEAAAGHKISLACDTLKTTNIFVENTLLFLPSLSGYPGPFIQDLIDGNGLQGLSRQGLKAAKDPHGKAEAIAISSIAVFDSGTGFQFRHGFAHGLIAPQDFGNNGFGWDSRFQITMCGLEGPLPTYAELAPSVKSVISMRAQAINATRTFPFSTPG